MEYSQFLAEFSTVLDTTATYSGEEILATLKEWDSIAALSTIAFADSHGTTLSPEVLSECGTIKEVYEAIFAE